MKTRSRTAKAEPEASGGKRKAEPKASDVKRQQAKKVKEPSASLSDRCELACYHAAFCGRGPKDARLHQPNASDLNFQGVLEYLSSSPPIDFKLIPAEGEVDWTKYSFVVAVHEDKLDFLSLLAAAVASECDGVDDLKAVAKRAIFEMVLLAGATSDHGIREFAGSALFEAGGGVHYSGDFACALLDRCTATAAARLSRWPGVLAEITAAEAGAAQYAVIHSRFLEICCEGEVDDATFEEMLTFFDDGNFIPQSAEWKSRHGGNMWALAMDAMQNKKDTGNVFGNRD